MDVNVEDRRNPCVPHPFVADTVLALHRSPLQYISCLLRIGEGGREAKRRRTDDATMRMRSR
jgi:hypothetical protein